MNEKDRELIRTLDKLIEEQKGYAEAVAEEIAELSGKEIDVVLLLDAMACAGLQLLPIVGENIPSLTMITMLTEKNGEE